MAQKELIFMLFEHNWSIRKINNATGIHRATITRYKREYSKLQPAPSTTDSHNTDYQILKKSIQSVPPTDNKVPTDKVVHFQVPPDPHNDPVSKSKSQAKSFHDIIFKKLTAGQNAKSVYQDLVTDYDYSGSYDSIKRYVRKLKKHHPKLFARIETEPGEEAQVDFGEGAPTLKSGRYKKPWLFVMTLSNSRKSYEEVVWEQDVETFIRCHERAFAHLGGVTKVIKIDNLKSAVLKAHLYEPELNPNYLGLAQHYNFVPLPCKVRTPEHKGKVESNVKYVQDNALAGKKFDSLEQQNAYLRKWNRTWASTRIHGTTKRQVNIMYEEEKPSLQSLPERTYAFFKIGLRKVSSVDSHIEVKGAFYPVSPDYMGKQVVVHYNSQYVKVYYDNQVTQFLSTIEKGRFHPDKRCLPDHKRWSQNQYIQYLFNQCRDIGPAVFRWAKLSEEVKKQRAYRSIQGVVALGKKYPYSTINQACQQCIESNALNYHIVKQFAESIRIEKQIQQEIQFTQDDEIIRSPQEYEHLLNGGD